jgi:tetratricopeptide (TPR) repeat protein
MALCASAQRVDSVANSAPTAKSNIPPEIVTKLQRLNADTVMPVEGVAKLVNEIFSWSRRNNRPDVNARLLSRYGIYLSSLGFFDLSTDIFRCASQFISPTDEKVYVFAQAGRAVAEFHNGLRSEAEATLLDIEKQVDAMPQSAPQQIMMLTIYNYLGDIYKDTGREPKAYENYEKSLKISMALGDSHTACVTISSMCALNFYNDRVESLLTSAMAMAIQLEDNKVLYNLLMAKAQLAYKEADYQRALVELEKAESYSQIIRNDNGNPVVLKQMCEHLLLRSRCYANLNQPARAYETMTNYLDEHDRRVRSSEELHNAHWSICHDLIAQCDAYHGDLLQAEQNNNWHRNRRSLIIIIFILSLTLAVMIVAWVVRVRKQRAIAAAAAANGGTEALLAAQYGEQLAAADRRIETLEQRERELTQTATVYSLYLNARNELLEKLRDLVRQGYKLPAADQAAHQKKISAIIALSLEKDSKVDKQLIDVIYEENAPFFEHLKARCATLTDNELRMALYVHVGISTRNIAQMTGQPVKTVSMTRFRLRKALGYDSDEEMNTALAQM